jgi:hypothetical protein
VNYSLMIPKKLENYESIILGDLAKLRKETVGFDMCVCLSVCPSVHMEQLSYNWKDFHEVLTLEYFSKVRRETSRFIQILQ